jgi:hypothetical protein
MKALKTKALGIVSFYIFLSLLLSPASSRGQTINSLQWGETVDGLQMSISIANSSRAGVPEFQVALRNSGEHDVTLNLGFMLANGKVQLPDKIKFNLTDATGTTRNLHFSDRRYPGVAGRMDDYIVPLRSGSIYTLTIGLDQLFSMDISDFATKLPPGKYQITAQYQGTGAQYVNLDTPGIKLMNFWLGELQSNTLSVEK